MREVPPFNRASGCHACKRTRSSYVKAEGQLERAEGTIRQQMDREEERELQAKREADAVTAKEEARPVSPIPVITPGGEFKRFHEESSAVPPKAAEQPTKPANSRPDLKVIDLIFEDGDAVMTDAESKDS